MTARRIFTDAENAMIRRLLSTTSFGTLGAKLNCSPSTVREHCISLGYPMGKPKVRTKEAIAKAQATIAAKRVLERPDMTGWPMPTTNEGQALDGRRYDLGGRRMEAR